MNRRKDSLFAIFYYLRGDPFSAKTSLSPPLSVDFNTSQTQFQFNIFLFLSNVYVPGMFLKIPNL